MSISKLEYKSLNENVYKYLHPSGLEVLVIPKKGFTRKYSVFGTKYGSINNEFVVPGENEASKVPDGIAHFLEHKLFDQEYGNVMDKFAVLGSQPNAYTSFNQTVYLFSCTDKFTDNFNLLLDYVQTPYLTDESVEREKGIIGQEIKMFEDDPNWQVFFNLLDALYVDHPVKIDIAGTVDTIKDIDRDVLMKCYNTFYHPSNMVIIVVGDVDKDEIFSQVEKRIKKDKPISELKTVFPNEPDTINKKIVEKTMEVPTPLFQMGFKGIGNPGTGKEVLKRDIGMKIVLKMLFGQSSSFYTELYESGLINDSFDFDYCIEENYSYSIIGGESSEPLKVKDLVWAEIEKIKKQGLDEVSFNRIRKSSKGRFLRRLNSVDNICRSFISIYFKDVSAFDSFEIYDSIDFEYIKKIFNEHFQMEKLAISIINPHKGASNE